MGLFLALSIIGLFLIAGIGYGTWRQQQTRSEMRNHLSRARKEGGERRGLFGAKSFKKKSKQDDDAPDNLEKALDAIKLSGITHADDSTAEYFATRADRTHSAGDHVAGEHDGDEEYDDLPSDEELAHARVQNVVEGTASGEATVGETNLGETTGNTDELEAVSASTSQLTLDEYGEPVPLSEQQSVELEGDEIHSPAIEERHESHIQRADVEWLNISMSYSGLISHVSAYIGGVTAFSVENVIGAIKDTEGQLGTRIKLHYRSTPGTSWRRLERAAGVDILELMLSVQLADRNGPISEGQLIRFASSVVDVAESIDRTLHWSLDIDSAAEFGEKLYKMGKRFDLFAIVHIMAKEGEEFSGSILREATTQARMQLNDRGAFEYFDRAVDPLKPLFTMTNYYQPGLFNWSTIENERYKGLSLFMDLPHISDPKWAYDEMVRVGHSIERSLNGTLLDREGNVLTHALSNKASEGIEKFAVLMKDYGMKPGGEVAMSLIG